MTKRPHPCRANQDMDLPLQPIVMFILSRRPHRRGLISSFFSWQCKRQATSSRIISIAIHPHFCSRSLSTTSSPAPTSPITNVISDRIRSGQLVHDHAQERAARRLARLQLALDGYDNFEASNAYDEARRPAAAAVAEKAAKGADAADTEGDEQWTPDDKLDKDKDERERIRVPRGMFIHGAVGTGKSMLMDTFYEHARVAKKRRVHFHSFMADVHKRIHRMKHRDLAKHGRSFSVDTSEERNPILRVATELSGEVSLLCFDEFQVTDVADALILSQLFGTLWARGVVVVATSNRPPSDLYEGGINRGYFLPFIDILRRHCVVHEFKSSTDYRRLLSDGLDEFFFVSDENGGFDNASKQCGDIFEQLLDGASACPIELDVAFGRTISVRQAHPDGIVGRFTFDELCNVELGSSDYRLIAQEFQFVIIEEIPTLTLKEHDQARRFITLVDELYEAGCALVCTAVAPPDELFTGREGVTPQQQKFAQEKNVSDESIEAKVGEMFGIDVAQSNGKTVGELASVRELAFAFERASSRLTEMCSKSWWRKAQL